MIDTKLMAMLTAHAHDAGAKLILVGDDRQLSSIDRGGMFGALKDRYGAAELAEVSRQHKNDERRAAEMMAEGNFHDALEIYEQKGRDPLDAHAGRGARRAGRAMGEGQRGRARTKPASCSPTPTPTWTSSMPRCARCAGSGASLARIMSSPTADGSSAFAAGDRIQFTGTDKKRRHLQRRGRHRRERSRARNVTVMLDGRKPHAHQLRRRRV